jgi:hypothetical protein
MRFFFYGTLMDPDLLSRVIGRMIAPRALRPALVHGYRRSAVRGANFPVVLRDRIASVKGVVLAGVSVVERDRLADFEGDRYVLVPSLAEFRERLPKPVLLFEPKAGAFSATGRPWSLERWQRLHEPAELRTSGGQPIAVPEGR